MHGTRERILEIVVRRREARVEDFAEELSITPAAVRRHLDNLRADGYIEVRSVKQPTGRPYYVYSATGKGVSTEAVGYTELLERMLHGLDDRTDVLPVVAHRMAVSLAERHRPELQGVEAANPDERIRRVTESLRKEGILDEWRAEAGGYRLVNGACPYRKAAEISRLPCDSDRQAIELLVGASVEQVERIVDGSPTCEYFIRAASPVPAVRGAKTKAR